MTKKVLVIDDEAGMRDMLRLVLERGGYEVFEAPDAQSGLKLLEDEGMPLVLCDIRMPGADGLDFLREFRNRDLSGTVVMMSAYGSIDTAVECLKAGAWDYISKPFKPDEVLLTLAKAEERLRLLRENETLRLSAGKLKTPEEMVFRSQTMQRLMEQVQRLAGVGSPVLVTGETGTGKELVARALHYSGPRKEGPFLAVNCSAIAGNLLESELFGHARGAFTGADRARDGLFLAASGGTLFLDEIGEMPLELQPKLLRVLQESEVRRVGETRPRRIDTRVVVATARDLHAEVEQGRFREDLYYRLAVVELHLPPLRDRLEDVPLLARHFVDRICRREGRIPPVLTDAVVHRLRDYHWPGNVRELENFLERTLIFCRKEIIDVEDLPWEFRRQSRDRSESFSLKKAVPRLEREYIRKALAATGGNRTRAAELLEISLRALHYKIRDYGLDTD